MKILVTGATGFIGGNLVRVLKKKHDVRIFVRRDVKIKGVNIFKGNLNNKKDVFKALQGVEVAYYLVHSMSQTSRFEEMEVSIARNFAKACDKQGVNRIIYLSGIIPKDKGLSIHLRSRKRTGDELRKSKAKVTEFRASIVVGKKGSSFLIIQKLVEKIPFLLWPKDFKDSLNQPIALQDALYYLAACLDNKKTIGKTYDIGGPDIIKFRDMLMIYAQEIGKKRKIIYLPFFFPGLYAYIAGLITKQPRNLIKGLMQSLKHDVICSENRIKRVMPRKLMSYREAVKRV